METTEESILHCQWTRESWIDFLHTFWLGGCLPNAIGKAGLTFKKGCINDLTEKLNLINQDPDIEKSIKNHIEDHLNNRLEEVVCYKSLKTLEKAYCNRIYQNQAKKQLIQN